MSLVNAAHTARIARVALTQARSVLSSRAALRAANFHDYTPARPSAEGGRAQSSLAATLRRRAPPSASIFGSSRRDCSLCAHSFRCFWRLPPPRSHSVLNAFLAAVLARLQTPFIMRCSVTRLSPPSQLSIHLHSPPLFRLNPPHPYRCTVRHTCPSPSAKRFILAPHSASEQLKACRTHYVRSPPITVTSSFLRQYLFFSTALCCCLTTTFCYPRCCISLQHPKPRPSRRYSTSLRSYAHK